MSDSNGPVYSSPEGEPDGQEEQQPDVYPESTPKPMRVARPDSPDDYRPQSPALQNPNAPAVFHSPDADEEPAAQPAAQTPAQAAPPAGDDEQTTGANVDIDAATEDKPFIENIKLSGLQLLAFGGGLAVAFIMGWFFFRPLAIPCLIFSLLIGTALPRLVATWRVSKWLTSGVLLGVTFVIYLLLIFLVHPLWARDRDNFSSSLVTLGKKLDGSIEKVTTKTKKELEGLKSDDKKDEDAPKKKKKKKKKASISATSVATNVGDFMEKSTNLQIWKRMLIFLQLFFFTGAFIYLPVFIMAATPGLGSGGEDSKTFRTQVGAFFLSAFHKSGKFSVVRLFKSILMAILTAIGLFVSGISGFWFIAVLVGLVSMICNLGPAIAVVLGAVLVPIAPSWMRAVVGLLITLAVLVLAEKKLDWYLRLVPMSKRYGLPPEMLQKKKGAGAASFGLRLLGYLPSLISLAVLAAIVLGVFLVCDVYKQASERNDKVAAARTTFKDKDRTDSDLKEIITDMEEVLEWKPNDTEAMLLMIKAKLNSGDHSGNMDLAVQIADPPELEEPSSLADKARFKIREVTGAGEGRNIRPARGYEEILKYIADDSDRGELQKRIGDLIGELDSDSAWSDYGYALAAYHAEQYEQCITHADSGMAKNTGMIDIKLVKARALYELQRYDDAKGMCRKILDLDSENSKAKSLLDQIRGAENQPPPDPDPAPAPEGDPE